MHLDGKYFSPGYTILVNEPLYASNHLADETISELSQSIFGEQATILTQTYSSNSFRVNLPASPIYPALSFIAETPSSEISRSLTQTPITPVCSEERPLFDALKTVYEAIEKWINQTDSFPDQLECEKYLAGMFTSFKKQEEMVKFFYLFSEEKLLSSFLASSHSWTSIKIKYGGKITKDNLDAVTFKKINVILFFLKYFQANPGLVINELSSNSLWPKQLLSLIWVSQIGKVGFDLLFKTLRASVNSNSNVRNECKKIFPPGWEVNKTNLGKITLDFFYILKNELTLLIPNDEKNFSFFIYPSQKPLTNDKVLEIFLKSETSESFVQLCHNGGYPTLEHVVISNVTIYDLIKNDDLKFMSFSLKFVERNFIFIKEMFLKYLNDLPFDQVNSLRNKNILKFYLTACIFDWKIRGNLKPDELVALSKEEFIAKTLFSSASMQNNSWIYYSEIVLQKAAIHDITPSLPRKRKLNKETTNISPDYPNKKPKV